MNILGHLLRIVYLGAFATVLVATLYALRHGFAAAATQRRSRSLRQIAWPRLTDVPEPPTLVAIVHRNKMRRGITVLLAGWLLLAASFTVGSLAGGWNLPVSVASTSVLQMWWTNTWALPSVDD